MKNRGDIQPAGQNTAAEADGDRSELIDHIYQVAIDPGRFETLIDLWAAKVSPNGDTYQARNGVPLFEDIEIESHAQRAGDILDKVDPQNRINVLSLIVSAIDPSAAFIINETGMLVAANASATAIFDAASGKRISDLNLKPAQIAELEHEATNLAQQDAPTPGLIRFSKDGENNAIVFRMRKLVLPQTTDTNILVVSSELAWPEALGPTMQEAFGITPAELAVVQGISEGKSPREIAQARGRALHTVKTQLRSILAKTGTNTQAGLMRVTLGLMDVVTATEMHAQSPASSNQTTRKLQPTHFETHSLTSGRNVDFVILGDPDGKPLLYLHFDFGLIRFPASAEAFAQNHGIRMVVPLRPGFGGTSSATDSASLLETILEDTIAILDQNKVDKCPILCSGGDSFFAYHLAHAFPDRFSAILNCSPGFPVFLPRQYERMQKWHRFVLANAYYAPKILPFIVKAGFSLAKRIGKRDFLHAVYSNSPADLAVINNAEAIEAMLEGSQTCLSDTHSAHRAYADEVILKQSDWAGLIDHCHVPIHVWHGDKEPQVHPETMDEIMKRFGNINFHKLDNAGQLQLFSHWATVFDRAAEYLDHGK